MADILREVFGIFSKRFRDMSDGSHAEVVAIGGTVPVSGGLTNTELRLTAVPVSGPLTNTELRLTAVPVSGTLSIASLAVPASPPIIGQKVIAVTGTAVALSAASVPLPSGSVLVSALSTNNAAMGTVGGSAVTNVVTGAGNGFVLEAGKSTVIVADNLNKVYVNGTAADKFSFSAG